MPSETRRPVRRTPLRWATVLPVIAAVSLVFGGLTSFGQTVLPPEFSSLANSSSGWSLPTAIIVFFLARTYVEAGIGGALGFVCLTLGYAVVSGWRGFVFDPSAWAVVGVLAGPIVGCAAHALRRSTWEAAVGGGVLAGIFIGEGLYGLTVVAATTSPVYWVVVVALGLALLLATCVHIRRLRPILVSTAVAVVVSGAFQLGYLLLGVILASL